MPRKQDKTVTHIEDAQMQLQKADSVLAEAERHLQELKEEQLAKESPSPSSPSSSASAELLEGASVVQDMLAAFLQAQPDDSGRITLPVDAIKMAHAGLQNLQPAAGFQQAQPPPVGFQQAPPPPVYNIASDEEMDPGLITPRGEPRGRPTTTTMSPALQSELAQLLGAEVVKHRIFGKKPLKAKR